jgi:hypothetical protein
MPEAEEANAAVVDDTSVSDAPEPSTNEEAQDSDDLALEDMEFTEDELFGDEDDDDASDTTEAEEPTGDSDNEVEEESEADGDSKETDDTTESEPAVDQKKFNDEMAKRRIAERQLREEREAREQEKLTQYIEEAGNDELELERRQNAVEQFNIQKKKAELNRKELQIGLERAMSSIDLFKSKDKAVTDALLRAVDTFEAIHVKKDEYGNPLEVNADVFEYLQNEAETIRQLTGVGARTQGKSKSEQSKRTLTPPTRTPKEPKVDPDEADFDSYFNS